MDLSPPENAPEPVKLLKAGQGFLQPDIWIVSLDDHPVIWKTWGRRPSWEKRTFGRWLAKRENRVIIALQDLAGFPSSLRQPHPWTIAMTLLDAEPVPEIKGEESLNSEYFAQLEEMLATMHHRGINHGDLRRKNLLRAPGDPSSPRIVDFTQCLYFSPPQGFIKKKIFEQAIRIDRVTFLKLKHWYLGSEALSEEEHQERKARPWHLRLGRTLRKKVYRPIKHLRQGKKRTSEEKKRMKDEG